MDFVLLYLDVLVLNVPRFTVLDWLIVDMSNLNLPISDIPSHISKQMFRKKNENIQTSENSV